MSAPMIEDVRHDPAWLPVHFDATNGELGFVRLSMETMESATFHGRRELQDAGALVRLPWQAAAPAPTRPRMCLLFHTAFCGSTLLSRILQDSPRVMVIREPSVLLDIAQLTKRIGTQTVEGVLATTLALLARPWTENGTILLKPTNQVNSLLPEILRNADGKAILLYSSLPEFIVSNCTKLPQSETFVRWLAQHFLRGSRLQRALRIPWHQPFHFIEACVLAWHAQMEIYADALAADSEDRLRSLDFATLQCDVMSVVPECARWLGLGADETFWQARAVTECAHDAKHTDRPWDVTRRTADRDALRTRYRALIDAALAWGKGVVEPVARVPVDWKPLLPPHM